MTREQMDQWLKTEEEPRIEEVSPEAKAEERRARIKFWAILLAPLAFWMALINGSLGDRLLFGLFCWVVIMAVLAPFLLFSRRRGEPWATGQAKRPARWPRSAGRG